MNQIFFYALQKIFTAPPIYCYLRKTDPAPIMTLLSKIRYISVPACQHGLPVQDKASESLCFGLNADFCIRYHVGMLSLGVT